MIIDLKTYIPKGTRYLSGRDEGNDYKKLLQKHNKNDKLIIKIPETIVGINMSFFLGMFDELIGTFKDRKEINQNIEFDIPDSEYKEFIKKDIDSAIDEILDDRSIGVD